MSALTNRLEAGKGAKSLFFANKVQQFNGESIIKIKTVFTT